MTPLDSTKPVHGSGRPSPRLHAACGTLLLLTLAATAVAAEPFGTDAQRILFLGDSITHAGHFITRIEARFLLRDGEAPEMINLGLPSETCTGLSEPAHPFPRPNVHERLARALDRVEPDVVVVCYGMNDGIYYPFSEERFDAYRRGMEKLIAQITAAGARLVVLTPPAFDPLPLDKAGKLKPAGADSYAWFEIFEGYDAVLERYSRWLVERPDDAARVTMTIDLHSRVNAYVAQRRQRDPDFTMSPDGVHLNEEGHAVLARAVLEQWGMPRREIPTELLRLVGRRQKLMHDAWLSHVGHQRPGMQPGLPLDEARRRAAAITQQIDAWLAAWRRSPRAEYDRASNVYRVWYPASTAEGELPLSVDYYCWIPPGVTKLRGAIVHQHGCGVGASKGGRTAAYDLHWQALARAWDCALIGSSYEPRAGINCRLWCDPRNGSAERFLHALDDLAESSGHGELSQVPWCLWGHSGGAFWASLMQVMYPERIVGIWLRSGTALAAWEAGEIPRPAIPPAAYGIPVVANPGRKERGHERFHRAWDGLAAMYTEYRRHDSPFAFAADPRTGHECGDSRYLAIPFFEACLERRLPPPGTGSAQLRPVDLDAGVTRPVPDAGDLPDSWWFDDALAAGWREYIKTGGVSDTTPPPPPAVTATRTRGVVVLTWQPRADRESGVGGFVIQRDGRTLATLPDAPVGRFGRPLFQAMSYHDTPEAPLPATRFVDRHAAAGETHSYSVTAVNSVGLRSSSPTVDVPPRTGVYVSGKSSSR